MAEWFTGGKVQTANRKETGLHSPFERKMKYNLPEIHKFKAITNLAFLANTERTTILWIYKCWQL